MSDLIVVGDCGGTNTRLSLWEISTSENNQVQRGAKAPGKLVFDKKYLNEEYENFMTIVKKFMEEAGGKETPKAACLACAGPILNNTVSFTNMESGWFIDGEVCAGELGIEKILLVNDFTAMGYGLLTLDKEECFTLNDVEPVEGAPVATVGAGTGLGECFLTKDPEASDYVCWATEGGHSDFPPRDAMEVELLKFLRNKFAQKHRVSVERVISGPGLSSIYEFLSEKFPENVDVEGVHKEWLAADSLKGGVVGKYAKSDVLCMKAMEIMMGAYASEVGNAMLKWLPYGGLYITGGIAVKNFEWIAANPVFKEIMFDKGRVSGAILKCPVYVCKTEDVGERGAHLIAYNLLRTIR